MSEVIILLILVLLIFLLLVILLIFALYLFDLFLSAPFVATKKEVVEKMIKIAEIKAGGRVLDLGSGDGRLVIEAARAGAEALGVEKNPFLVLFSKIKIKLAKVEARITWGDIFSQDLSSSDIIFLYLNPKLLAKLAPKIAKEGKIGTKIISNTYKIPGFKFTRKFDNVFLYEI